MEGHKTPPSATPEGTRESPVSTLADDFHGRVTQDPSLASFFAVTDTEQLKRKQADVLRTLLGLGGSLDLQRLRVAHARLDIGDAQFDRVVHHLRAVLEEHGTSETLVKHIVRSAEGLRAVILNR